MEKLSCYLLSIMACIQVGSYWDNLEFAIGDMSLNTEIGNYFLSSEGSLQ